MKRYNILLLILLSGLLIGCQKWIIVRLAGSFVPEGTIGLSSITKQEQFVHSNFVAVAEARGLVPISVADQNISLCFTATNYDGRFVLSLNPEAQGTAFTITIAESPAFKRSTLSLGIEADLLNRLPDLRRTKE